MIQRTLILTLFLGITYSLFLVFIRPETEKGNGYFHTNAIKAQQYIYQESNEYPIVVVGTSLSYRLIKDSIPGNCKNLGLAGLSTFDGLNIIKMTGNIPEFIFIEINGIIRDEHPDFTHHLCSPTPYNLCKYVPMTRYEYSPLLLFANLFTIKVMPDVPQQIFNERLAMATKFVNSELDHEDLNIPIEKLKKHIAYFEKKGTQIIFFQMPVNIAISSLDKTTILKEKLLSTFPVSKYVYIEYPKEVKTRDGLHLTNIESQEYSSFLNKEMLKIISGKTDNNDIDAKNSW